MGLKSRSKGKVGEREAAHYLKAIGFHDARRRMQSSGEGAPEVECPQSLPGVHIEVKYGYAKGLGCGTRIHRHACAQAMSDAEDKEWVVLWREKHCIIWKLTMASANGIGVSTLAGDDQIRLTLEWLQQGKVDKISN